MGGMVGFKQSFSCPTVLRLCCVALSLGNLYPEIKGRVSILSDFYLPSTNKLMDWNQFGEHWACDICQENLSIQKLQILDN